MCRDHKDTASLSNFQDVQIRHADLDWEVDFQNNVINGSAFLVLAVTNSVDKIVLDCRDLIIYHVYLNDQVVEFTLNKGSVLGDQLIISVPPLVHEKRNVLHIIYCTSPKASALQFLNKELTLDKKVPFLYSQCQAIHARSIVPSMDTPAVKMTYSARVRVPKSTVCLMSALRRVQSEHLSTKIVHGNKELGLHYEPLLKGETATFYFYQPIQIPSYLIAIVVAALEKRKISDRCAIWAEPSLVKKAAEEFADTEIMLQAAEQLVGVYRWGRYDLVVLPSSFPFGGMENPCLTFVTPTIIVGDKSLTNVIAHEISHSWTGNLVTNYNWEHFWLNEGFTVYVERKIMGRLYGEALRQFENICGWEDRMIPTINEVFSPTHEYTKLNPKLEGVDPDESYSTIPYEKGSAFLLYLEQSLGDASRFEQFLKAYIEKFAFKSIVTNDWKNFLYEFFADKKSVLDAVNWDGWLKAPGIPPNTPKFDEQYLKECRRISNVWIKGTDEEIEAEPVATFEKLSSVMKVKVIDSIESSPPLSHARAAKLESKYALSKYENSEILFSSLLVFLKAKYEPVIPIALDFACKQGRLKYAKPVFTKLFNWEVTRERAISRYTANIPMMHPITVQVIETILKASKEAANK